MTLAVTCDIFTAELDAMEVFHEFAVITLKGINARQEVRVMYCQH